MFIAAKEKERQTPDETHHSSDGVGVREPEREGVRLRHDAGGALLPVHPQLLQPARHQSGRLVSTSNKQTKKQQMLVGSLQKGTFSYILY